MELVLLRRLVAELQPLVGTRTDRIYALPRYDLVVGLASGRQLWISVEPDEPHLCLRGDRPGAAAQPPAFAMAARKWGRGRCFEALELVGDDRVVRLRWAGGGSLVAELIPRRATAFVLDADDGVVAVWNPRRGRPDVGARWTPPESRSRTAVGQLDPSEWQRLRNLPDPQLRRELMRAVAGMSSTCAAEIVHRREDGPLEEIVPAELSRSAAPGPVWLYSAGPLEALRAGTGTDGLLLAPCELAHRATWCRRRFDDVSSGATFYFDLRARLRLLARVTRVVGGAIEDRRAQLAGRARRLAAIEDAEARANRLRRRGDLLLANPGAEVRDGRVEVSDLYAEDQATVSIAVNPDLDLAANAQKLYRRAQRLEAEQKQARRRGAALQRSAERLDALEGRLRGTGPDDDIAGLIEAARELDLDLPLEKLRDPEAGTAGLVRARDDRNRGAGPGILEVTTANGARILIGRSARANDRLTREVAAPHDWWLHAEGPGSHVVLLNPRRLEQPPPDDLADAAALAAWFSKARGSGKVEVRWTEAGRVRKPRGAPAGAVLLESHHGFIVQPRPPSEVGADPEAV